MKAIWNNEIVAESDDTVVVEGNHYFPLESVRTEWLKASETTTNCPWKGTANYYSLDIGGEQNPDCAWYYAETKAAAEEIRGRVAFWKGVAVVQ